MKNFFIFLIIALILCIWGIFFLNHGSLPFINRQNSSVTPTSIPVVSVYPSVTLVPTSKSTVDEDIKQIQAAVADKYNKKPEEIELTISQIDSSHALGGVKFNNAMEGGWLLAAKDKLGQWVVVQDGNGTVTCELIAPFDFSVSMVPECVDQKGKLIKL